MENNIYPGYTEFSDKSLGPGRYIIQVDLADRNDRWCDTWFGLVDIDGEGKIAKMCLDFETEGLSTHAPASFNGVAPVAWKPFPYKFEKQ